MLCCHVMCSRPATAIRLLSRTPQLGMRPDPRVLAQQRQLRTNAITGTLLFGFVGGVIYYVTHAVKQGEINEAELEAFKAQREAAKANEGK